MFPQSISSVVAQVLGAVKNERFGTEQMSHCHVGSTITKARRTQRARLETQADHIVFTCDANRPTKIVFFCHMALEVTQKKQLLKLSKFTEYIGSDPCNLLPPKARRAQVLPPNVPPKIQTTPDRLLLSTIAVPSV